MTDQKPHPWARNYPEERDMVKIEINMPREMHTWLLEQCKVFKLPPWRLVAIALDNEREQEKPFDYPCYPPNTVYLEHAYAEEAAKILDFLGKWKNGMGRDTLLLFRRQIGIPNKVQFLLGLRELLAKKMAVETEDFHKKNYMEYPLGYKVIKAVSFGTASPRRVEAEKNKLAKLEAKLKRQQKRIEQMGGTYEGRPVRKAIDEGDD